MSPFGPVPLTPTAFLDRARVVHGDRLALVDGQTRRTYDELADRCERLAGALAGLAVEPGDRVSGWRRTPASLSRRTSGCRGPERS